MFDGHAMTAKSKGLLQRLKDNDRLIVAEGYLFEFERRGYLKAGAYVPEVVLEHPDLVKNLYEEFVHAGSDVVLAFTYYAHREKLRYVGREHELEAMNRTALRLAREVADKTGTLMAGDISNSTVYDPGNPATVDEVLLMFKEQVDWAVKEGADYIVGESFYYLAEAKLALDAIKKYGNGLPAVITMSVHYNEQTYDDVPIAEAMRQLEQEGAAVVGVNCGQGPTTMIPTLKSIRRSCKGPIAALPTCYRTTPSASIMQALMDPDHGKMAFPYDLDAWFCSRSQIEEFGKQCEEIGVQYVGLCCGNCAHYMRTLAMTLGRTPPAARYSPDMSQHFMWGDHPRNRDVYTNLREFLNPALKQ